MAFSLPFRGLLEHFLPFSQRNVATVAVAVACAGVYDSFAKGEWRNLASPLRIRVASSGVVRIYFVSLQRGWQKKENTFNRRYLYINIYDTFRI